MSHTYSQPPEPHHVSSGPGPAPYASLEAWRGFASIWVVMFHTTHALTVRYPGLAADPLYAFSRLGGLGVQLFFVISGYCIAAAACNTLERPGGPLRFLKARAKRIYPPFWAAWALAAGFSVLAGWIAARRHVGPSYSGAHNVLHESAGFWLSNLTLTQEALRRPSLISSTWTLSYEVGFYLAAGLLVVLLPRLLPGRGAALLLTGLHLLTAGALLLLAFFPAHTVYPLDLWPQFGFGVLVYDLVRHPRQRRPRLWLAGCAALLAAALLHPGLPSGAEPMPVRLTFGTALGFALILWGLHGADRRFSSLPPVRLLASVGVFSYSLYLIHMLVIGVVNQAVLQARLPERLHPAEFWVTVAAALLAGRVFYLFCERPFVKPIQRKGSAGIPPVIAGQSAE